MSDCADMTTDLARELTQGIKNEVEDLALSLKKMAKLKPIISDVAEIIMEDLYDPYQVKDLNMGLAENIENTVLHELQQFKITNFPVDFDPFAENMAA